MEGIEFGDPWAGVGLVSLVVGHVVWQRWSSPRQNQRLQPADLRFLHRWGLGWGLLVLPAGFVPLHGLFDRVVPPVQQLATLFLGGYLLALVAISLGVVRHTFGVRAGVFGLWGPYVVMMVMGWALSWSTSGKLWLPNFLLPYLVAVFAGKAGARLDAHEHEEGSTPAVPEATGTFGAISGNSGPGSGPSS